MRATLLLRRAHLTLLPDWCSFSDLFSMICVADPLTVCPCAVLLFSFCLESRCVRGMYPANPTTLSTTPSQAGYIGLFTGASLFSIMVVPLLQLLRRRDRRESLAVRPLDTLYSPYHNVRASRVTPGVMGDLAAVFGAKGEGGGAAGQATPGGLP